MDQDPDLVPAIKELINIINEIPEGEEDKYEIELRLGWLVEEERNGKTRQRFDPDIGSDYFSRIKEQLSGAKSNLTWKGWDRKKNSKCTDYYKDNLRLTIDSNGNRSCYEKIRLINSTLTYNNCAFDIRISLSTEIPKEIDEFGDENISHFSRQKKRDSFVFECWSFDLTTVVSADGPDLETTKYEIELEMDKVQWFLSNKYLNDVSWLAHSTLVKLRQLIFMCEIPGPEDKPLMILKEKIDKRDPLPSSDSNDPVVQEPPPKIKKPKVDKPKKQSTTKSTTKSATKSTTKPATKSTKKKKIETDS